MCGICGEFRLRQGGPDTAGLDAMRLALGHRGPDDSGLDVEGSAGFAHTRLSIIDLSPRGRQPIACDSGSHSIVFNGEIYNYKALRAELEQAGRIFSTDTDTEVAVTALAQWGEQAFSRFIGMFAIAAHDRTERSLLLARDRLGVKPLYYSLDADRLLFASEPRAILAHPGYTPGVNRAALASYLMCGYFPGEETIYAGIRKLPAGSWLRIHHNGATRSGRYWSLEGIARGGFTGSFEEAVEALRPLLADAFSYRLVADVPVGMFLSGGVDSSLVAAILKKDAGVDLKSFTLGFSQSSFDEADKAQSLCSHLGWPLTLRRVDAAMAQQALGNFHDIYDEPFGDPSGIPTYLVSVLAREHVKVTLSADGGDELFCGYTGQVRYPSLHATFSFLPAPLRGLAAGLLRAIPAGALSGGLGRAGQALPDRLDRLARLLGANGPQGLLAVYAARGFFQNEAARLCANAAASLPEGFLDLARNLPEDQSALTSALMAHDVRYWLPDNILIKVDRASMHVGLESRDPLLDHRIAEFAASLPLEYLSFAGSQKRILRRTLADLGLGDLAGKPKRGFEIPLALWLAGPWKPFVERYLNASSVDKANLLEPAAVRKVVEGFQSGKGESAQRVWLLLSLFMWADRWLPGGRA